MGQVASSALKAGSSDLSSEINKVALDYITSLNFDDMQNLMDTDKCNEYILVTSEVLEEQLKTKQVADLYQAIHPVTTVTVPKGKVTLISKKSNSELAQKMTPFTKADMCKEVAQFYLTIAHVFAAIATSINPSMVYTDANGNLKVTNITNKPADVAVAVTQPNFCNKLINALQTKEDKSVPGYCSLNAPGAKLNNEPGIPELEPLYYDVYEQKQGRMSEKMQAKYADDVAAFYKVFTGQAEVPAEIKKFSDISLQNYAKTREFCTKPENGDKTLTKSNMDKYAEHITIMMGNANTSYQALLRLLQRLFTVDDAQKVSLRNNLTQTELDDIVKDTRTTILDMYKQCHADFVEGMKLYEALIYNQYLETTIAAAAASQKASAEAPTPASATGTETSQEADTADVLNDTVDNGLL